MHCGSDLICSLGESRAAADLHSLLFLQRWRRREILEDNRDAGIYVKAKQKTAYSLCIMRFRAREYRGACQGQCSDHRESLHQTETLWWRLKQFVAPFKSCVVWTCLFVCLHISFPQSSGCLVPCCKDRFPTTAFIKPVLLRLFACGRPASDTVKSCWKRLASFSC